MENTPESGSAQGGTATAAPPEVPPAPPSSPVAPQPPEPPKGGRSGATAGIVLIVIGLVFLAGRLIPGLAWWNVWPLIIIVAGLFQAFTPGKEGWSVTRMFDGFVTVAFGGVFLAITLGYVGWGVWGRILALWPVLLISIGLDLLGKALHTTWLRVVGSLAIIAALGYAVAMSAGDVGSVVFFGEPSGQPFSYSEPAGGVREASLDLEAGVAEVSVQDGSDLVTARGVSPWGEPTFDVQRSGSSAEVQVSLGDDGGVGVWPGSPNARLDVTLSRSVMWDATVSTGVSTLDADLSDVQVRSLLLKPGVADCDVRLGDVPTQLDEGRVAVESGVSSVVLRIPQGAEARVKSEGGLTGTNIDSQLASLGGGVWETPGYSAAQSSGEPVWVINVKSGVGSFALDTY